MSPAQRTMLFSMFNRACQAAKITGSISRDQYREQLTIKVCGDLISWNDFNNRQIDAIKAELLAILKPADLDAQLGQVNQPERRASYAALSNFSPAYVSSICKGKFGHDDLERLTPSQRWLLNITLFERARAQKRTPEQKRTLAQRRRSQRQQEAEEPF